MLLDLEPVAAVRVFLERGGDVLLVIGAVTFLMWTFMLERLWYFKVVQPREAERVDKIWKARSVTGGIISVRREVRVVKMENLVLFVKENKTGI